MKTAQSIESTPGIAEPFMPLSGDLFGAMINLSGRRRFTSQRIVLYAMMAAQGDADGLTIARDALGLFRDAHHVLIKGDGTLPGIFCAELQEAYFGKAQGDRLIRNFISLAERTLDAIENQEAGAVGLLADLVRAPTPILATLNQLTSLYEDQAKQHALQMKMHLRGMITDIEKFSRQARMVALNARIVAARAGEAGREFAVVARVLAEITSEIDDKVSVTLSVT